MMMIMTMMTMKLKMKLTMTLMMTMLELSRHRDLPLELRANCGHILVLVSRLEREERVVDQVQELVREGRTQDGLFSYENCGAVLALLHGILSSASKDWVVRLEKTERILSSLLTCYMTVSARDRETSAVLGTSKGLVGWAHR